MDLTRIQRLCEFLEKHLGGYQALADYLSQEKKYLLALDLEGIFQSARKKEELALEIEANTRVLVEIMGETALALGFPPEPQPLLADLAACLPAPYRRRLSEGAMTLARLKNVILRENEAARAFIEESLRLVNESVDILTGARQLKGDGYNSTGGQGEKKLTLPVKLSREV